jgi:hypothetical protein
MTMQRCRRSLSFPLAFIPLLFLLLTSSISETIKPLQKQSILQENKPKSMANKSSNSNLTNAKNAKNDEFYT